MIFVTDSEGNRKAGPLLWIGLALCIIIPSVLLFTAGESGVSNIGKKTQTDGPSPIQTRESDLALETGMPNLDARELARRKQIAKEQQSGLRPEEIEVQQSQLEREFQEKVEEERRSSSKLNFLDRLTQFQERPPETAPTPTITEIEPITSQGYMTFAERLAAEQKQPSSAGSGGGVLTFQVSEKEPVQNQTTLGDIIRVQENQTEPSPANILPLGTFIPAVLEQDVISTDLQAHVWATVAQDVTFRRQLQLPMGLVRLRGKAAREPVQNLLDISFDVMVFSDGTELPISGFAYSAFDIRYPDRFRVRGVPGKLITPPFFNTLQSIIYSAALGASDAYIQNYTNQQTTTSSEFTTVPAIDPITGQVTSTIQQTQGQPVNSNIGGTIGLSAGQATLNALAEKAQEDLDKYRPYVKLQKGTPIFVQLDSTIDIGKRQVNGMAIAAQNEAESRSDNSARAGDPDIYPPGDARHRYDNRPQTPSVFNPATGGPSQPGNINMREEMIKALKLENDPEVQRLMLESKMTSQEILNQLRGTYPSSTPSQ